MQDVEGRFTGKSIVVLVKDVAVVFHIQISDQFNMSITL